jgi:hypothetical protein
MGAARENRPNRLLELPPELRNYIYCLIVVHDEPVLIDTLSREIESDEASKLAPIQQKTICPSLPELALTSRQIFQETAAAFYRENTFKVFECSKPNMTPKVRDWLTCANRAAIHAQAIKANIREIELVLSRKYPIDIWPTVDSDYDYKSASLTIKMRDGKVKLQYGGGWSDRCNCDLAAMVSQCDAQTVTGEAQNNLLRLVAEIEDWKWILTTNLDTTYRLKGRCRWCKQGAWKSRKSPPKPSNGSAKRLGPALTQSR